jgi:hypothetical protein
VAGEAYAGAGATTQANQRLAARNAEKRGIFESKHKIFEMQRKLVISEISPGFSFRSP